MHYEIVSRTYGACLTINEDFALLFYLVLVYTCMNKATQDKA